MTSLPQGRKNRKGGGRYALQLTAQKATKIIEGVQALKYYGKMCKYLTRDAIFLWKRTEGIQNFEEWKDSLQRIFIQEMLF